MIETQIENESILIADLTDSHIVLLKIALKVLGDYCKFDRVKIYESKNRFEVITICAGEKYVTRTYIGKCRWKALSSYYKVAGEDEVEIYIRKK